MKSLYDSALSGISKLMSHQIDGYNEAKDSAVSSLEAERDARLEVIDAQKKQLEAQIDLIDEQIEEKEKVIDSINKEIQAMKDARIERQKQLDLQRAQYELEKMMHMRTQFIYDGEQMVYRPDESGARDAKEKVDEAEFEIEISKKEKEIRLIEDEIDLLNEQKDAIQDQIDALDKQSESIEKYYSKMIESTEKYYDSLIKNMEQQKSKWEELADIQEIAEAYSAIEQVFGELGYSIEDVLNGSAGAFEDFKSKYISLINDMNSNSSFAEGLSYATGVVEENLGSFLGKTQETANGLDELGKKASELDTVATSMSNASTSASALNTSTEGLNENLTGVSNAINGISTTDSAGNITTLAEAFTALGEAITIVAEALGIGEEVAASGIVDALTAISEISLGAEEEGIIGQFNQLKTAVDSVTNAISGGGSEESGDDKGASNSSSPSMGEEGSSGGLSGAITEMGNTATETLGEGGGEDGEGEGEGVISKFNMLKTAVDNVTTAIGVGGEEGEGSEENANTLIGALQAQYEKATEVLPETKSLFEELLSVIESCVGALNSMVSAMTSMQSISMPSMGGSVSVGYNGTVGKAFADGTTGFKNLPTTGYKGLPHDEKNTLRSEYGQTELTVYPNGKTEITTQPTMADLPKGTVIFNEEQTKKIINSDGKAKTVGKAYANGTRPPFSYETFLDYFYNPPVVQAPDPSTFDPFSDPTLRGIELFEELTSQGSTLKSIEAHTQEISRNVSTINTKNIQPSYNISNDINITCPGVTSQAVMNELGAALDSKFSGLHLDAYQHSMKK